MADLTFIPAPTPPPTVQVTFTLEEFKSVMLLWYRHWGGSHPTRAPVEAMFLDAAEQLDIDLPSLSMREMDRVAL